MSFFSSSIFNFKAGEAFQYKADMREAYKCIIPSDVSADSLTGDERKSCEVLTMRALYHFDLPKFDAIMWDSEGKKEPKTWKVVYFIDEGGTLCSLVLRDVSVGAFERFIVDLKKMGADWYKYQVKVYFSEKMISKRNGKAYFSLKFALGEKNDDEFSQKYIDYVTKLGEDFYLQTYSKPILKELMQNNGVTLGQALKVTTGIDFAQKALPQLEITPNQEKK
jgi:hypothetical protein